MLKSMTGFGRAEITKGEKIVGIEIKSLNGKQLEVNLKIPALLKPYEFDIRGLLQQSLQRGSLDVMINIKQNGSNKPVIINNELAKQYYQSIIALADDLQLPRTDILNALLKLPEVVTPATEQLPEEDWNEIKAALNAAMEDVDRHRLDEGDILEKDMRGRIGNILQYLENVKQQDPARREKMRQRLESQVREWAGKENVDKNRLEQELIYYLEKLDISEEQVRLANHCRYFKEILEEKETAKGKKLGFVLQEIGREINTIGSKANDASIQQWVVMMKDELEKAKEQVLNVL
ncbi:MAG TPA: YicC/YloC family endoribonuclease [Chitinophagaceae bacterium]